MAKEILHISPNELEGWIKDSAKQREVELDAEKNAVIAEIVSTVPDQMQTRGLTLWCRDKVDQVLQHHADLLPVAEEIQSDVRKELYYRMWKNEFDDLAQALTKENPDVIMIADIKRLMPALTTKVERTFSSGDGKVDWEWLVRKMGFEAKFQRRTEGHRNLPAVINELLFLLEDKNPEYFSPSWIAENNPGLYGHCYRRVRTKFGVNWQLIVDMLPAKWRDNWYRQNQRSKEEVKLSVINERLKLARTRKSFEQTIADVEAKIAELNPDAVTPSYIFEHCSAEYTFFRKFAYNDSGKTDWDLIVKHFSLGLQKKWSRPKPRYEDYEPKKHYSNREAVERALDPYRDKLYTVVEYHNKSDRDEKDRIIGALVNLAQQGNDSAKERLLEYLQYSISNWLETGRIPEVLSLHSSEVLRRTERAIYLHRQARPFLVYLQVNLKMMAKGLNRRHVELTGNESPAIREDAKRNGKKIVANGDKDFSDEPRDEF